jgi:hypothetical protein
LATIPLPALDVKPPATQPGPLQQYASLQSLMAGRQQLQAGQLENQQRQTSIDDQKAMTQAMRDWDGKDYTQLPSLVLKNGGSANAVFAATQHIQDLREKASGIAAKDAQTNASNLESAIKNADQYRGRLLSIINAPAEQKQQLWDDEITKEEQAGKIQPGKVSHTYPGDDQATIHANGFALGSVLAKEATEKAQASARQQQADAATQQAGTSAQRLQLEAPGLGGQVTPKDIYVQQQENYRAALGRQATNANELQRQGISNLQKQSDTYTQFLGTANSLKQSLAAAKTGNEMAAAVAPLQGTLFITTSEGVKRINQTELEGVAGAGSLAQRIEGALGKQTGKGPLSDSLKNDMAALVDLYVQAKYGSYEKQAQYTQKLHGLDPEKTPILDQGGNIAGLKDTSSLPNPAAHLPAGNGRTIDKATAQQFYQIAGGDPKKAMALAIQNGWKVQ